MSLAQTPSALKTQQLSDRIAKLERDLKLKARLVNDVNEDKVPLQLESNECRIRAELDLEDANEEIHRLKEQTASISEEILKKYQDLARGTEAMRNVEEYPLHMKRSGVR